MCPWPLLQMMLCKTETKCWDRRDGRKRDSNMKTQQPPQIAGLLRRVDVQGDDFCTQQPPQIVALRELKEQRAVPRCELKEQRAVPRCEMSSGRVAFAAR